jgi:hypothetical protein
MKKLIYLLIPLLISCKSNTSLDQKSLKDYQYPLDSLVIPKVFIYQRTDSLNIESYHYQQLINKNNQKLLIQCSLGNGDMRDSSVYLVNGNRRILQEDFLIVKDKKSNLFKVTKGEIIINKNNGINYESRIKFNNPFDESLISIIDFNLNYDTILNYQLFNKNLSCIRLKNELKVSVKNKFVPLIGNDFEKYGEHIYAKNLGLIFYSFIDKKDKSGFSWKLKEIINYKDFKMR